jgi:hypothetical protein
MYSAMRELEERQLLSLPKKSNEEEEKSEYEIDNPLDLLDQEKLLE